MACCADVDGEIPVGNLREATFEELWEGPLMTRYRLWHIEGRFENIPKCLACGGINFYKMTPEEIHDYLEEQGRLDLYPLYRQRLEV